MKTLYLLRHAKSSWSDGSLSDKQRPLNQRGEQDAPAMGARFNARGESLQTVLSSPALRARCTAKLFSEACGFCADDVQVEAELYFLGSGSIETVITSQDNHVDALMLVFHNPDITYLANSIDDELHIDNVPTCGLLRLHCNIASWQDWSLASTAFEYFDYPKNPSLEVVRK